MSRIKGFTIKLCIFTLSLLALILRVGNVQQTLLDNYHEKQEKSSLLQLETLQSTITDLVVNRLVAGQQNISLQLKNVLETIWKMDPTDFTSSQL